MRVNYEYLKSLADKYTSADARGVGYIPTSVYERLAKLTIGDIVESGSDVDILTEIMLDGIVERAKSELKYRRSETVTDEELSVGDTTELDSFLNEFTQRR